MLTYCTECVMPSTKPDLTFDSLGVCAACNSLKKRELIDWGAREREFSTILERYKSKSNWDCIVPVSGGKDSTCQIIKILELGYKPLAVTATTCDLTAMGRQNLQNISQLGVDHVEFNTDKKVRRTLNRIGLERVGDISWPEHVSIFTIPVRAAVQFSVPLIIWGENSQNEYGGPAAAAEKQNLDRRWLEEFGGMLGMRVSDLPANSHITEKDLIPYTYPTDSELSAVGVTGLFLGHFFPWDGLANAIKAKAYGFQTYEGIVEGSMADYENLDNYQTGIHDYFKFLKFGFSRTSDIASLHVRRGRLSRSEAMDIVKLHDGKFPWSYLGKHLEEILEPLEIGVQDFIKLCDKFTNKKIFKLNADGSLMKDRKGNLTKINYDN